MRLPLKRELMVLNLASKQSLTKHFALHESIPMITCSPSAEHDLLPSKIRNPPTQFATQLAKGSGNHGLTFGRDQNEATDPVDSLRASEARRWPQVEHPNDRILSRGLQGRRRARRVGGACLNGLLRIPTGFVHLSLGPPVERLE